MLTATLVLLIVVRDLRVCDVQNPGICDGHTIGIAGNILEDQIDAFGRRTRVDDPVFLKASFTDILINDDTFLLEPSGKQIHESTSESGTHSIHRKHEVAVFTSLEMMPHALFVYPTSKHNAVNVGVVKKIRSPRMEDGSHASKQSLSRSKCIDGAPCSLEHTIVKDTLVGHCNGMQAIRHCEYDMEVLGGDDFLPAECDPLLTLLILTLWTMTVTTAVVTDMHIPTLRANLHMPAKGTGAALSHVSKGPLYSSYDVMTSKEFFSVFPYNLTEVIGSPHFFLGGNMTSIRRTCFMGSMLAT